MSGGGGGDQVVGHRYYFDIHMGICRGPVDALVQIDVGDKKAWPLNYVVVTAGGLSFTVSPETVIPVWGAITYANVTAPPAIIASTNQMPVAAPNLFGGDDKEGGIDGLMDVMMGEPTQMVNPRLAALLGGSLISAFRGVLTIFYSGLVTSVNPYPKPWKFRIRRILMGWDGAVFYPSRAQINLSVVYPDLVGGPSVDHLITAMNPAHIIYECITNRDWGRGAPREFIDEASFTVAADQLYAEGFGLCLKWAREDTIDSFVQQVTDHIGAVLYLSRETGLLTLRLIRSDYNPLALEVFTTSNGVVSVEEDDQSLPGSAVNELIVSYVDPITGKPRQVRVQNLASMQSTGAINSKTTSYPGLPTGSLALRVAQRDLRIHSADVRRFKMVMNRRAWNFVPGYVFKFTDPLRGINEMILRVGKVEDHSDSQIVITVVEDIFGLSLVSFAEQEPPPPEVDQNPVPAAYYNLYEANYRDLYLLLGEGDFAAVSSTDSYVYLAAARPNQYAYDYHVYSGNSADGYFDRGIGQWTPLSTLALSVAALDTTFTLTAVQMNSHTPGIGDVLIVDSEIALVTAYNSSTGVVTVYRGCVDTIPAPHSSGARVWFISAGFGADSTGYLETTTVGAAVRTRTSLGALHPSVAPVTNLVLQGRHSRPYPPANVRVNGTPFTSVPPVPIDFTLTWVHRNKVTQGDVMLHQYSAGVTPPAGLTYTVEVRRQSDNALLRNVTGIATASWQYTETLWAADGKPALVNLILRSVDSTAAASWQSYTIPLQIIDDGWGMNFGNDWGNT